MRSLHRAALTLLVLSLAACGTFEVSIYRTPTPGTPFQPDADPRQGQPLELDSRPEPLGPNADSESIRRMLLRSHERWVTIWLDGVDIRSQPGANSPTSIHLRHQVWVAQSSFAFRLLTGPAEAPDLFRVSDGAQVSEINLNTGAVRSFSPPPSLYETFTPPEVLSDSIEPHPMEGQLGSVFGSLIFPSGLAQRRGLYRSVAMDMIAGREVLVAEWITPEGARPSRYWIDVETGVILRAQNFGKDGGEIIESEQLVHRVLYGESFEPQLFDPQPPAFPSYSDAYGNPELNAESESYEPLLDPFGAVYFFMVRGEPGSAPTLVRLPGSCVIDPTNCPDLETVAAPFVSPFKLDQGWWAWSPDGSRAAFVYQPTSGGGSAELVAFDPQAGSWQTVARFPFIDLPVWSGDAEKLAFRVQDGQGRATVYVVSRDGAEPRVLFEPEPIAGGVLAVDGWLGRDVLATSSFVSGAATIYRIDAELAAARIAFQIEAVRPRLVPSPNGGFLAYTAATASGGESILQILSPTGDLVHDLGLYVGTVHPIVWSPAGNRLAFHVQGLEDGEVFVVQADGTNLQHVYSGKAIAGIAFSPDASHLLIEGGDEQRLFLVDLSTLAARLLRAPGLGLNTQWRLASWQPPVEP